MTQRTSHDARTGPGRATRRDRRRPRWAAALAVVALLGAPATADGAVATATAAGSSTVRLEGRGFGHGIGMSQYGARGAAERGLTWQQITGFYYPGTVLQSGWTGSLRVNLSAMRAAPLRVLPATGLLVDTGRCTQVLPASTAVTGWRVVRTSAGWQLQTSGTSGAWTPFTSRCAVAEAPTITFRTTSHATSSSVTVVRPDGASRAYRGFVTAVLASGTVETVNVVALEQYLWSVVPGEMPASWPQQALAAQSVAARSYAAARIGATGAWDICDTTACQVYPGRSGEADAAVSAVAATSGVVLSYEGRVATAMFSSSNGGQVAPGGAPYLQARVDPYEAGTAAAAGWSVALSTTRFEQAFPAIGTFRELAVTRDGQGRWGGRATTVRVVGSAGSVSVSGYRFQTALGLRSTYVASTGYSVGSDVLGNAFPDVAALGPDGTIWAYPGDGRGGWLSRRSLGTGAGSSRLLAPGDIDGDGLPDLLVRTPGGSLILHAGTPTGGLATARQVGRGWSSWSEMDAPGDLDGDGHADLLARDAGGALWLYRGDGAARWPARTQVGSGWGQMRESEPVGDFTGDGYGDLVAVDGSGKLRLYAFSRTGTLSGGAVIGGGWGGSSALTGVGDWDGDGPVDLLARDSTGGLNLYRGDGAGGWAGQSRVGSGWGGFTGLAS